MESLADILGEKRKIEVTTEEAMLVDWVLTLHSYDETFLNWLMNPDVQNWREQVGRVILDDGGVFVFNDDDLRVLLTMIPITFRFGDKDVGYSLKRKLLSAYLGEKHDDKTNNETKNEAPSIPGPQTESL